jgi:O-antigen ligase
MNSEKVWPVPSKALAAGKADTSGESVLPSDPLERVACLALLAFAGAMQVSIAAADILLTIAAILWIAVVIRNRERIHVPKMFWPLAAYAAATLVAAIFSVDPRVSLIDSKQLVLLIIVPIIYRLLPGKLSLTAVDVVITVGALSATYGIVQYLILNYDDLGRRPQGSLGLYMTYSGLLMLVTCAAVARLLFASHHRQWAALVMPALVLALAFTFTRSAWVGACVGVGLLFLLRDFRLVALLPVAFGLFLAAAPAKLTARFYSTFSLTDPSNVDRVAMMKSGFRIIADDPLTGVGPDMIIQVYPHYRDKTAVNQLNPHLHNVPLQIAAERGLPALALWVWFIASLLRDFIRRRREPFSSLSNAGIAVIAAMLAAGLFEYNFGDSEFLMLFLVLVTLPYAAERSPSVAAAPIVHARRAG